MDSDQSSLTLTRIVPVVDAVTLRFLAALPFLELLIIVRRLLDSKNSGEKNDFWSDGEIRYGWFETYNSF